MLITLSLNCFFWPLWNFAVILILWWLNSYILEFFQTSSLGPLFFWSSSPSWTISFMWHDSHSFLSRLTFLWRPDLCLHLTLWVASQPLYENEANIFPKPPFFPYFLSWLMVFVSLSIMGFICETDDVQNFFIPVSCVTVDWEMGNRCLK